MNASRQTSRAQSFESECHVNNIKGSQEKSPFQEDKDVFMDGGKPYVDPKITKLLFNG